MNTIQQGRGNVAPLVKRSPAPEQSGCASCQKGWRLSRPDPDGALFAELCSCNDRPVRHV